MKKYAMLALATVFMFSAATMAQDQTPPQGRRGEMKEFRQGDRPQISAEKRAERMAKDLELSDAEKIKVQALFEKQDAKRQQHQNEAVKTREDRKAEFEAERKVQDAELEKIIGKEKFQKHETLRAERQEKMKQWRENATNDSTSKTKRGQRPDQNKVR